MKNTEEICFILLDEARTRSNELSEMLEDAAVDTGAGSVAKHKIDGLDLKISDIQCLIDAVKIVVMNPGEDK